MSKDWKIIGAEIYFTINMLIDCVKCASIAMCENAKSFTVFLCLNEKETIAAYMK